MGKTITVEASYTDGQGTAETGRARAATAAGQQRQRRADRFSVTIDNTTPAEGDTVDRRQYTWPMKTALGAITYTWKADGSTVGTGATYTLTQAEVGKTITVEASYTDGQGTAMRR